MLDTNIFHGSLVRLTTEDPETAGKFLSQTRDSEYTRLLDTGPVRMWSARKIQSWIENDLGNRREDFYYFLIRTLVEDRLIGFLNLYALSGQHGDTWLGIGLGERAYWDKGYGTDAVRVILRYAFRELNLRRVSLYVFEYNQRAIRAYEKAGFKPEGHVRSYLNREGQRWDLIYMGILKEEWLQSSVSVP